MRHADVATEKIVFTYHIYESMKQRFSEAEQCAALCVCPVVSK